MSTSSARPSLPTSSTDFALPPSSSSFVSHGLPADVPVSPFLTLRTRRPTALGSKLGFSESRMQSPLATSFRPRTRDSSVGRFGEESESDRERERMCMDSPTPPSGGSQNTTPPPLGAPAELDARMQRRKRRHHARSRSPSTPPRTVASSSMDILDPPPRMHMRRLSYPIKPPRILTLLQESRPEENELKSEAQFQRILASTSDHPLHQCQPRAPSDRGRYPEEVGHDEIQRPDTPSDGEADEAPFAYNAPEPVAISKPTTPSPSLYNEDLAMIIPESPGGASMDIDMFGSPSLSAAALSNWRYTPPPTSSAVRSNKRKFNDDRYEPYPTSKRRAVSPSVSHLRDTHRTPGSSRGPVAIAIPSGLASGASSPTVGHAYAYPPGPRAASSPTMRNAMILASPILRPTARSLRRDEEDEREIDGAGHAVGGLTLS